MGLLALHQPKSIGVSRCCVCWCLTHQLVTHAARLSQEIHNVHTKVSFVCFNPFPLSVLDANVDVDFHRLARASVHTHRLLLHVLSARLSILAHSARPSACAHVWMCVCSAFGTSADVRVLVWVGGCMNECYSLGGTMRARAHAHVHAH